MGCLYTKNKSRQYSNNAARRIQVHTVATNGSIHTNGLDAKQKRVDSGKKDGAKERTDYDSPETSQMRALSPRPLETLPPTPEEERPSLSVQYAEDLQPVSPLPDVITVATIRPKQNRVDVSTVSLNSTELSRPKNNTMLSKNDVTIEELDTELDHYSRYSPGRYPNPSGGKVSNPGNTDVLLPRRKQQRGDTAEGGKQDTGELTKPKKKKKKRKKQKESLKIIRAKTPESLDLEITELSDEDLVIGEVSNVNRVGDDGDKKSIMTENAEKLTDKTEVDDSGAKCENEARVSSAKSLESTSQFVPKEIYQKQLEKERLKRKRKHGQNRKRNSESTQLRVNNEGENKTEEELKRGLKAKPLFEPRPGSGTSVWTIESTFSLKSQDSRLNVYPSASQESVTSQSKSRNDSPASRFSYVPTGTTPISFKQDAFDQDAQLLDLETEYGADEGTGDSVIVSARIMDPYYGIKPIKTESDALEKNSLEDLDSGSSTSYLLTKQKLLYSRFARRPNSETHPRLEGKPPLPPGSTLRMRPSSDIERGYTAFSRYFTTDLDIH